MSWVRQGDTVATDPRVLALARTQPPPPEVLPPGAAAAAAKKQGWGFFMLCASLLALHTPEGLTITPDIAEAAGGPLWRLDVEQCVAAGLMVKVPRKRDRWKLVDDPSIVHVLSAEEVAWNKKQRSDNSNPAKTMPARLRDGDSCRYCGHSVSWGRGRAKYAGTYEHRVPGVSSADPDDHVVACYSCNSTRGAWQLAGADVATMDQRMPLRPPPERPLYLETTAHRLSDYFGRLIEPTSRAAIAPHPQRPDTPSGTATGEGQAVTPSARPQPAGRRSSGPAPLGAPGPGRSSAGDTTATPSTQEGYRTRRGPGSHTEREVEPSGPTQHPGNVPGDLEPEPHDSPVSARGTTHDVEAGGPHTPPGAGPPAPTPPPPQQVGHIPQDAQRDDSAQLSTQRRYGPGRVGSGRVGSPPGGAPSPPRASPGTTRGRRGGKTTRR